MVQIIIKIIFICSKWALEWEIYLYFQVWYKLIWGDVTFFEREFEGKSLDEIFGQVEEETTTTRESVLEVGL